MRFGERLRALVARPLFATLVLASATAWLLWPVPRGQPVLSQDHTVHMFRAWHFVTKVLARGHLTGWSDHWFAGWPAGQDYPPGGDWWLAVARLLTFPFSWGVTYAFGFFAMYVASALALWRAARRLGPVAALLGALLFVLDCGEYREGGFIYSVYWGVWPQQLSTASLLLGLVWLDESLGSARWRDAGKAAAAIGFALLCHPLSLVSLAVALPPPVLLNIAGERTPWLRAVGQAVGVTALGWGLAALFTVPFGARSGLMAAYGDPFRSLPAVLTGLWRGDVFQNVPAPLVWLSLAGLVLGVIRRQRWPVFLGLFALLTLAFASTTTTEILERVSPSMGRIQYQRLIAPAKACLFALAAWTLSGSWGPRWLRPVGWLSLVIAPIWAAQAAHYPRLITERADEARHYRAFLDWSRAEQAENGHSGPFYRIAYVAPYNDHFFAAAPIENDTPAYKVGFTPAANFVGKPDYADDDLYRVLSVKWVVARGTLFDPQLSLARRFGDISVYRFAGYDPRRYTLTGPGTAHVERFQPEHIRIGLSGTDATSRIVLHVAAYPAWRARLDGHDVPIRTVALASEPIFMEAPADGRLLEVDFVSRAADVLGRLISLLALAIVAALLFAPEPRARAWLRTLPGAGDPRAGRALLAALTALVLAIGLVRSLRHAPPPIWRAVRELDGARADMGGAPCPRSGERLQCPQREWTYVGKARGRIGGVLRACVWAHPLIGAPLRVTFPDVPRGHELVIRHGLFDPAVDQDRTGAAIRIDVAQDGQPSGSGVQPNRKGWFDFTVPRPAGNGSTGGDVTPTFSAPKDYARDLCFDAEVR
ncbi:MAG: hypothetical protein ABUR63_09665 [Verrucomicrobiota bacterium]